MNNILQENEKKANIYALILLLILDRVGVALQFYHRNSYTKAENTLFAGIEILCLVVVGLSFLIPKKNYAIKKYVILFTMIAFISVYCVLNPSATLILYLFPLAICCRYYDKKFFYVTAGVSLFSLVAIWVGNAFLGISLDMNLVHFEPGETVVALAGEDGFIDRSIADKLDSLDRLRMNLSMALPQQIVVCLFYIAAFLGISKSGTQMMEKREQLSREKAYVERDLKMAASIQSSMLTDNFAHFGGEEAVSVYATMYAAKNVGGDFYDFYMLDERHLCFVIGDVSGKGMPAALFMVKTLTTLKNYVQMKLSPDAVLEKTNASLSESNKERMFVTIWLGILDTQTGDLEYCVGGHNPPLLKKADGDYDYLRGEGNCMVGAMPGITYALSSLKMEPGDELFLYTDGVTDERNASEEMYKEARLLEFLNRNKLYSPKEKVEGLRIELDAFSKGCEQFDDITMLCVRYEG